MNSRLPIELLLYLYEFLDMDTRVNMRIALKNHRYNPICSLQTTFDFFNPMFNRILPIIQEDDFSAIGWLVYRKIPYLEKLQKRVVYTYIRCHGDEFDNAEEVLHYDERNFITKFRIR